MGSNVRLLLFLLFIGTSAFSQKTNLLDSLKCTQYFDSLSNRPLYRFPEKNAEYKGGAEGIANYMNRKFIYDKSQITHQTIIVFTFIVEADGSVSNVTLKSAPEDVPRGIIEKALNVLSHLPKIKPAECNKQKVAIRQIQPIVLFPN